MTTLREAAQQALEALKRAKYLLVEYDEIDRNLLAEYDEMTDAITAIRAALAEPVQEPVAENKRLIDALHKSNSQAEHFERLWYLCCDEIERLQARTDTADLDAIAALNEALAEPVQEPVAWAYQWKEGKDRSWYVTVARWHESDMWHEYPLYTAPQQPVHKRTVTYVCPVCAASLERQE
jgi:hypothetical protein